MISRGRLTLRCLRSDLVQDWEDADQQRRLGSTDALPPLDQLSHPVVRHARDVWVPGQGDGIQRESISGLSNPPWWKLKTNRWRGAVHEDHAGQAWLCAAGLRRDGSPEDFYAKFMADVQAKGSDYFLPTGEDRDRLDHEQASGLLLVWEQGVLAEFIDAFDAASIGDPQVLDLPGFRRDDPALARVTVTVEAVGRGFDAVVGVLVDIASHGWEANQELAWIEPLLLAAIEPQEQNWEPGHAGLLSRQFSLLVSGDEFNGLLMEAIAHRGQPRPCVPGSHSHYVHKGLVVERTVFGKAIQAVCGAWFVPRQDYEGLPVCPRCSQTYATMP